MTESRCGKPCDALLEAQWIIDQLKTVIHEWHYGKYDNMQAMANVEAILGDE